MLREPNPLRGLTSTGNSEVVGKLVGKPGRRRVDAVLLEVDVSQVLVVRQLDHLGSGQEDERVELCPALREQALVEIGQRDDQRHAVLLDRAGEEGHVAGIVDPRRDDPPSAW